MALSREEIGTRYGVALFGFVQDNNSLDKVQQEILVLKQVANENPKMINYLADPVLNLDEKKQFLNKITANFSEEIQKFLNLLLEYNRFDDLLLIIDKFLDLYNESKGFATGQAITAVRLDDRQLAELEKTYANKYHYNELKLENKVDPEIIGGVILKVADQYIDGSIKTKLNKIRAQLINNE